MNDKISDLKKQVDIVDVIGRRVTLKKRGSEFIGTCPFHSDKKASLRVNKTKQVWGCFACSDNDSKGDVLDFLLKFGVPWIEALNELKGKHSFTSNPTQGGAKEKTAKVAIWTPVPSNLAPGQITHYKYGKPSGIWIYRDVDGKVLSAAVRFDLPGGGKDVLPLTYCKNDEGKLEWRWQAIPQNRPLYNLDKLAARPTASVLVVEGEKTADAAAKLFPNMVCVCWQGGANGLHKSDWRVLSGRNVSLWPDNDKLQAYGDKHPKAGQIKPFAEQPGNHAMLQIAAILNDGIARRVKWIANDDSLPDKWDVADAKDWTPESAKAYAKANLIEVPAIPTDEPESGAAPGQNDDTAVVHAPPSMPGPGSEAPPDHYEAAQSRSDNPTVSEYASYFTFLGYQKEADQIVHCFFVRETRTLLKYNSGRLARTSTLIQLAPLDFWEGSFAVKRGGKVNVEMALNWLCRVNHESGFFSNDRMRGRGAWMDDGRSVFHSGDQLIVNGRPIPLGKLQTRFVYEAGSELGFQSLKPLSVTDANRLMDVTKLINFDRDVDAFLLAGWCVVAPVCGALKWRSHIWVTGSAGSGKSWVLQNIIRVMLGKTGVAVQSETTEAGLRQLLGSDALPVVFDEAEGEDERSQRRMQTVLALMRAASADDGGIMAKGTSGGQANKYTIRSAFAFASIGLSASHQSDRTRITLIGLKAGDRNDENRAERWRRLQELQLEVLTTDFVDRLQSRTIQLLPTIIENARTFAAAAAAELGEQRLGDQIGSLLAGAYSLFSNSKITYEAAVEWVKRHSWEEERSLDESKDETRLIRFLLESIVTIQNGKGSVQRAVGELVRVALDFDEDPALVEESAVAALKRFGITVTDDYIFVSNTSNHIRAILRGTAWAVNHHKILMRVEGAISSDNVYFTSGLGTRAVGIPTSIFSKEVPKPSSNSTNSEDGAVLEDLPF